MVRGLFYFLLLITLVACGTARHPYIASNIDQIASVKEELTVQHITYLVGDAGKLDDKKSGINRVMSAIDHMIQSDKTPEKSIVFLGDNIYPSGLHEEDFPQRALEERILKAQTQVVAKNAISAYVIPGNHDWNEGRGDALAAVIRQERYLEGQPDLKDKLMHLPNNGCGDPVVVEVEKGLNFVFLDTQWWLQDWEADTLMNQGCEMQRREQFLEKIGTIFKEYKNQQLIVFMHHPVFSNGNHGGFFSWKDYLFPLEQSVDKLYLPLPMLGLSYVGMQKRFRNQQDISHPNMQTFLTHFKKELRQYENVVVVSGHEHLLQHNEYENNHFLISGSGSKVGYARSGKGAQFVYGERGFMRLVHFENGGINLEVYAMKGEEINGVLVFRYELVGERNRT